MGLKEDIKKEVLAKMVYNEPKEYDKHGYIDNKHAKEDLKKEVKFYGGRVIETIKETNKGFTWLIAFKDYSKAKEFEHTNDDAGRTKSVTIVGIKQAKKNKEKQEIKESILKNSGIIQEDIVSSEMLEEGIINNMITKRMYAKTDKAERNIRIAEKNHPEYIFKKTTSGDDDKKIELKMNNEQKAFALKCRDLSELREMIKKYKVTKDRREKLDLFTEIVALLNKMPEKHKRSNLKDSIYTAAGFGAFMYAIAIPAMLLFRTVDGGNVAGILAASAALSAASTVKLKRGITYAKNMQDNITGVKKGKENIKSLGKRDRFSSDLEKFRSIDIDVDSVSEKNKIQKRKEFIDRVIAKISSSLTKAKKIENTTKNITPGNKKIGKLVKEGYFDGFNSFDDFYINEDGAIEEGMIKNAFKAVVLTSAILFTLSTLGISTQEVKSTIINAGGRVVQNIDNNVNQLRGNDSNLNKSLVIAWDSASGLLGNLSKKLAPVVNKLASSAKPIIDAAAMELVSNTCLVASGITQSLADNEATPENLRTEFSKITTNLRKISKEVSADGDNQKVNISYTIADSAFKEITKAQTLVKK